MLRASILQKAGALAKHGIAVTARPPAAPLLALSLAQRSYTTTPKHIRKRQKQALEAQRPPDYLHDVSRLRDALQNNNISLIASAYTAIRTQFPLGDKDVADIAKALHTSLRLLSPTVRQKRIPTELVNLADLLVADIQARVLPPSYDAHLHLMSYFKESTAFEKGNNFWSWLVKQGDDYVNAKLYGVALELLAVQGRPAEETETLYSNALARFPGVFLEYHLAHNAVLADRSQPTAIAGIPMTLLQGILTARILRGDATNAYLTLDTAMRLYPTKIPSRFVTLFVQERPLAEAYKTFLLACQAGASPGHDALKILLTKLRKAAVGRPIENAALLRSMLIVCYAHTASGAAFHSNSINELVIAITGLLKDNSYFTMSSEQLRPATDAMCSLIQKLFGVWIGQSSNIGIASFNSIIANLAGHGKRKEIIDETLHTMESHGLKPNLVTFRSLLGAAADMGDVEGVYSAWTDLVALRISTGAALDISDWQTLLSAARRINDPNYVRQQLSRFEHVVPSYILGRIDGALADENFSRQPKSAKTRSTDELMVIINALQRDVDYLAAHANLGRNFYVEPLPLAMGASGLYEDVPEQHIRTVYDEMTTDTPASHLLPDVSPESEAEKQPPAVSPTGFPFDELRYQNWKTINDLLYDAELSDSQYMSAIDDAIKLGKPPPGREMGMTEVPKFDQIFGLSDLSAGSANNAPSTLPNEGEIQSLESFRQKIFELRGRKA